MTEDVFLGLSDKDPSSAHCEAMVVRIECPRHRLEDLELDVKKHKLLLQSSTLCVASLLIFCCANCLTMRSRLNRKLVLHLPHPVRHQDGRAKWDAAASALSVTLPIIRDEW